MYLAIECRYEFYFKVGCILAIASAKSEKTRRIKRQTICLKDLLVFNRVSEETYVGISAQLALLLLDFELNCEVHSGLKRLVE